MNFENQIFNKQSFYIKILFDVITILHQTEFYKTYISRL